MLQFIKHLIVCAKLYKRGYYFSNNDHKGKWGFYRLNFEKGNSHEYAIMDIDFKKDVYSHAHRGNKSFHRWDA